MGAYSERLSIILASGAGGDFLFRYLHSLRDQAIENKVKTVVVDRCSTETIKRIKREYNFARVIKADLDHTPSVPELRTIVAKQLRVTSWQSLKSIV